MDSTSALALTVHLTGIAIWVGTLFSIAALLVQRDRQPEPDLRVRVGVLARNAGISADVGAAVAVVGGLWLLLAQPAYYMHQPWMHMKLTAVVVMLGLHGLVRAKAKRASLSADTTFPAALPAIVVIVAVTIIAVVVWKPLAK